MALYTIIREQVAVILSRPKSNKLFPIIPGTLSPLVGFFHMISSQSLGLGVLKPGEKLKVES